MSVLVNLEIPVKKERIEDFFDYLRDILVDTRAYKGCIRLETYHEMENSKVLLIEEWEKIDEWCKKEDLRMRLEGNHPDQKKNS